MCDNNDFNDFGQCASHTNVCGGESDLSRWEFNRTAHFVFEWNHGDMVTGLEQPSDNDVFLHSYRWTMCDNNDFNDYHQSHDCSHFRCGECDLSRWEFSGATHFVFKWNLWYMVTSLK